MADPTTDSISAITEAFDRNTDELSSVKNELHSANNWGRFLLVISILEFLVAATVLPNLFITREIVSQIQHNAAENHQTLVLIQQATGPASKAQQATQLNALTKMLITCEENHTDQVAAEILGKPIPPTPSICPKP